MLCRDRCGYCTFAKPPARLDSPYLELDAVLAVARAGRAAGCWEALFTLGESAGGALPRRPGVAGGPRLLLHRRLPGGGGRGGAGRDRAAAPRQRRRPLPGRPRAPAGRVAVAGHDAGVAGRPPRRARRAASPGSRQDTRSGAWPPWRRPGRPASRSPPASSSGSARPGRSGSRRCWPSPPPTARHGHVQEVIVQNFLPKPGTGMAGVPPCPQEEMLWTVAVARLLLDPGHPSPGAAEPRLRPGRPGRRRHRRLGRRLAGDPRPREPRAALAGARPAPAGHRGGRQGPRPPAHRLPRVRPPAGRVAPPRRPLPGAVRLRRRGDGPGARLGGRGPRSPPDLLGLAGTPRAGGPVGEVLAGVELGQQVGVEEIVTLLGARGPELAAVCELADDLRRTRGRRRRHLRAEPQHQLHQRLHVQVQVLRLLQGPAVAQPPGRPLPPRLRGDPAPGHRGGGVRRHRGLPPGRHPPQLRRRLLPRGHPGGEGRRPRHPRPRLHRPRGVRGRPPARDGAPRVPGPAQGDGPGHPARHGGRDPRRRGPGRHLPRQGHHRRMARGPPGRPLDRAAVQRDDHVRPRRAAGARRPPPRAGPGPPGPDRRVHRGRPPAVRPHGQPDLPPEAGPGPARPSGRRCSSTPCPASP